VHKKQWVRFIELVELRNCMKVCIIWIQDNRVVDEGSLGSWSWRVCSASRMFVSGGPYQFPRYKEGHQGAGTGVMRIYVGHNPILPSCVPRVRDVDCYCIRVPKAEMYFSGVWVPRCSPMHFALPIGAAPIFLWPFSALFATGLGQIKEEANKRVITYRHGFGSSGYADGFLTSHGRLVPRTY
jgi:hypothetical protein